MAKLVINMRNFHKNSQKTRANARGKFKKLAVFEKIRKNR
jgi:hypothetical protein